ncbi:hypothetical protein ABG067_007933, partial [Albugo candida]
MPSINNSQRQQHQQDNQDPAAVYQFVLEVLKPELIAWVKEAVTEALGGQGRNELGFQRNRPLAIENTSLDQVYENLIEFYGTIEKRNNVYSQPNLHGTRDFSRSDASSNMHGKKALLFVMALYYRKMQINLGDTNEEIDNALNERYGATYAAIRNFVEVQLLAGRDSVPNWSDLSRPTRDAYSLLVEDFVERTLGASREGLPLFCTEKHYAVLIKEHHPLRTYSLLFLEEKALLAGPMSASKEKRSEDEDAADNLRGEQVSISDNDDVEETSPPPSPMLTPAERIMSSSSGSRKGKERADTTAGAEVGSAKQKGKGK